MGIRSETRPQVQIRLTRYNRNVMNINTGLEHDESTAPTTEIATPP